MGMAVVVHLTVEPENPNTYCGISAGPAFLFCRSPNKTITKTINRSSLPFRLRGANMTKRYFLLAIFLAVAITWTVGCSSIKNIMKSSSSTSTSSSGKTTSKGLYSNVPASMRAPVKEASFDLKRSESDLKLAKEGVKLAELKSQRAVIEKKQADLKEKLAETKVKKGTVTLERTQLEAIDNANLGDKASNIKKIAAYKTKELDIQSDVVNTKAEIETLELEIKKLDKSINLQARKIGSSR
jgi:hypothetical protein